MNVKRLLKKFTGQSNVADRREYAQQPLQQQYSPARGGGGYATPVGMPLPPQQPLHQQQPQQHESIQYIYMNSNSAAAAAAPPFAAMAQQQQQQQPRSSPPRANGSPSQQAQHQQQHHPHRITTTTVRVPPPPPPKQRLVPPPEPPLPYGGGGAAAGGATAPPNGNYISPASEGSGSHLNGVGYVGSPAAAAGLPVPPPSASSAALNQSTRALVKRFVADIWNRGAIELIPQVCSPALRFNGNSGFDRIGHDGLARMVATIRGALEDYHCEIHSMVVEDNKAFCRLRFTGRHTGPLLGYEPTRRTVAWMGATEFTCLNGKILKVWELGDVKSLEEQLMPEAGAGTGGSGADPRRPQGGNNGGVPDNMEI